MTYSWQPASGDVALLVAQRVLDGLGSGLTDFTDDTKPTKTQVDALAAMVSNEVAGRAGTIPTTPVNLEPLAKNVAAKGTAMWVELSYYADDERDHAATLRDQYTMALLDLAAAVDSVLSTGTTGTGADQPLPVWGFPTAATAPVTSWTTGF